jgi:prolyl-tRNA editing enzyme YbaK/EbsC (Cys-tRNA(Pro) deacylase)
MGSYSLGSLETVPVSARPDLVASVVLELLERLGLADAVGVVEIDPSVSDTAASQEAFGLEVHTLVNCVIVGGKRAGEQRHAACLVPASTRVDVNTVVKRRLDVRKASFLPREEAVELSAMEYGGITPIGLPAEWPILVDDTIPGTELILIGSGIRKSKLILPGRMLLELPGAEPIAGLGRVPSA